MGPVPSRPAPPRVAPATPAVRVIGYLGSEKGVGEGARATVRALHAAGIPVVLDSIRDPTSEEHRAPWQASHDGPAVVNLVHINPKELAQYRDRLLAERAAGHRNIGYWAWELPELPRSWRDCVDLLDEVWTPSRFVTEAVARTATERGRPVHTVPHCLDLTELAPQAARRDRFTFFTAFDHRSDIGRKNPLGTIDAFRRAFPAADQVELVVKSMHAGFDPAGAAALRAAAGRGVRVVDGVLTRAEVVGLLAGCDCYVSLHRAEGFGLLLAEAMALGKPVIATDYSGNTDFLNGDNGFPVRYTLVPVGPGHGDYEPAQLWAEPDLDHAAALMRAVVADRASAEAVGRRAREQIRHRLSPAVVGELVRERLAQLRPAHRSPVTAVPVAPVAPSCSIVIPVYGRAELTRDCLRAVLATCARTAAEIVVVDDASPDDTGRVLAEFAGRITVLTHRENQGFAQSCNDGAAQSNQPDLVFLNNDTVPGPGWLDALLGYARAHPAAGVIGAKLLYPDGTVQHAGVAICEDHRPRHIYRGFPTGHPAVSASRRFQVVTGACMLVRRELFTALGGFDLAFRNGFEDVDLCLRAGETGAEVHYCADCVLTHHESATRRGRQEEELRNFAVYWDRWAHRVIPDELRCYVADGLLRIRQYDRYPLEFDLHPALGFTDARPAAAPPTRSAVRIRATTTGPRPRTAPPVAPDR